MFFKGKKEKREILSLQVCCVVGNLRFCVIMVKGDVVFKYFRNLMQSLFFLCYVYLNNIKYIYIVIKKYEIVMQ